MEQWGGEPDMNNNKRPPDGAAERCPRPDWRIHRVGAGILGAHLGHIVPNTHH